MPDAPPLPGPSDEDLTYITRPTRRTLFLRTFVPWQAWRFLRINSKMMRMVHRRQ